MKRRKLGVVISAPIEELWHSAFMDSVILVEEDHEAALKTRAAALMYIGRNKLDLKTTVRENEIWIMKDKDILGEHDVVDLRPNSLWQ